MGSNWCGARCLNISTCPIPRKHLAAGGSFVQGLCNCLFQKRSSTMSSWKLDEPSPTFSSWVWSSLIAALGQVRPYSYAEIMWCRLLVLATIVGQSLWNSVKWAKEPRLEQLMTPSLWGTSRIDVGWTRSWSFFMTALQVSCSRGSHWPTMNEHWQMHARPATTLQWLCCLTFCGTAQLPTMLTSSVVTLDLSRNVVGGRHDLGWLAMRNMAWCCVNGSLSAKIVKPWWKLRTKDWCYFSTPD